MKKCIAFIVALALVMGMFPMSVFAAESSIITGPCGENCTFSYDKSTYTLTISGTGVLDYSSVYNMCWNYGIYGYKNLIIDEGITEITDQCFYPCSSLTHVELPDSLMYLSSAAFTYSAIKEINIPKNVTPVRYDYNGNLYYEEWFSSCDKLEKITVDEENPYLLAENGTLYSKDKKVLFKVPQATAGKFSVPNGVEIISRSAFEGCQVSEIDLPTSLIEIQDYAFGCEKLTQLVIPNGVETISYEAFPFAKSLVYLYIPATANFTDVTGAGAGFFFSDCINLQTLEVDENNPYYTSYDKVLYNKDMTNVINVLPSKKGIYDIPEGVKELGDYCFWHCPEITAVNIPSTLERLHSTSWQSMDNPFENCHNYYVIGDYIDRFYSIFTEINVSEQNETFSSEDGVLFSKDKSRLIAYPQGKSLSKYTVPDGVVSVGPYAFCYTEKLRTITFPSSVSNVESYAIYDVQGLNAIIFMNPSCLIEGYNSTYADGTPFTIYGYKNSTAEEYAKNANYNFVDVSNSSAKYTEQDLKLYYSINKDNVELGDIVNVGADYLLGNSLGMLFDGDMRWELSNPEVLQLESYSTKAALLYFKAIGLGSCDITLYLNGEKAVSDTITIKVSDKTLLEDHPEQVFNSSAFSTLETARNTCKEIIDGNNGFYRSLAAFFKSVENGLGVGVITKEALAAAGLTTSMAEEAEDEAVEKIMIELIGAEDPVGSAVGKIEKAYKFIKTGYSTATVNKERFFDTIVNVFDYSYEQAEELYNKVDDYKSKTDIAFDVLDVTLSAMLISQFEMDTIKDMRDATSYGSALYLSLNRLYEKRADLVAYATDRFLNEQAIGKLNELIGKLGGSTYKVAKLIGTWSKMIYDHLGGLDAEDYLVAQNNWGFAGYLYNYSLKVKSTPENFERYYKYYIAAVKAALISAVDISRDYRLTNIADGLYEQIELTCHYEDYFDQVRNDLNNVCSVSKETFESGKVLACYGGGIASYSLRNTKTIANEEATSDNFYNNIDPEKIISIPSYIDGSRIKGIADYGFIGLTNIHGFMLPQTIETIGEYAFANNGNAKFAYLNSGVTEIGEGAFANCEQLEVINLPETLQAVGDYAFANCTSLGSIAFGKNVTTVGAEAFDGCTNLKTVFINNASTVFAQNAFENCEGITVYGHEGSTAQTLADNCGFAFVAFENAVAEMRIITPAAQQSIVAGDVVSADGLTIEVQYIDGTKETISGGWSIVCDTTSAGVQQVYVCYKDGSVSYPIIVTQKVFDEITLSEQELSLFITDSRQLVADCEINHTLNDLIWSSDNEEIAQVDESGYVTALKVGNANITVSSKDGSVLDRCKVTVVNNESLVVTDGYAQSQIFSPTKSGYYTFYSVGSSANITAVLYNINDEVISASTGKNVEISAWLVDDEAYYIELQTTNGSAFILEVSESVKAESIKISTDKFSGKIGTEHQLEVNYEPLNSLREELVWESDNEEIVSVDQSGLIKLHKAGTAVITVTSENGLIDTVEVTVEGYPIIMAEESRTVNIDQNNQYAYFRFIPDEDGFYSFYSYDSDHDTYGYILNSDMEEITSDDDSGDGTNFNVKYQLEAGVTYVLKARFLNTENSGSFKVCVEQTKYVTALEIVSPPERTEYVEGFVNADNINYYGLKLKVTWSDGSTTDWKYDYDWSVDDEYIYRDASNIDETGNVELTCGEVSVTLTLTIIENPVDHIEIVSGTDNSYVENYNGYIDENEDGEFFYYHNSYPSDAVIKIVYTNGSSETARVGETVNGYSISWEHNQYNEPWVVGANNKSIVTYLGHTVILPITVKENTVTGIEVVSGKVTCIENAYGYETGNGYYYYYDMPSDVALRITYSDGTSKVVNIHDVVDGYNFNWEADQYETPWTLGDDNYVTVTYLGQETPLPVSVITSPVESIVINAAPSREYIYGDREYGYLYSDGEYEFYPTDLTGLSFTVYYVNGTNKTFTADDIDEYGDINGYGYELYYDEYNAQIGDFPVQFMYMGKNADYVVKLKESTVSSIAVTKQPNKTEFGNYYSPDFIGMELTITYTDGSTKVVTLTENNLVYEYNPWWGELTYTVDVDGSNLTLEPYYGEDDMYFVAYYLGESCDIMGITYTEEKEIDTIGLDRVSWNGDGMTVKITYTNESTETLTLDLVDFFDFEDSSGSGYGMTDKGLLYYYIETDYDNNGRPEEYRVSIFNRQITVKADAVIIGDVNGDGAVDNLDRLAITRYLADWDGYTETDINMAVADVNNDGSVDNLDRLALTRHLANWEGYEELPMN